jgi:thymidylate kinase
MSSLHAPGNALRSSSQLDGKLSGFAAAAPHADALHPLLDAAFRLLEGAGLNWSLLRVPSDPSAPTGDVDLLIERRHLSQARTLLRTLGFAKLPGVGSGSEYMLYNYHSATDHWICLHAVTEIGFGAGYELRTGAENGCLERRQRQGHIARVAPADEFWITLLHCLLDKGCVPLRHRCGLQQLLAEGCTESPLVIVVARACPNGWSAARVQECVAKGEWDALERFAPELAATWRQRCGASSRLRSLVRRIQLLPSRVVQGLLRRGLTMAVLGPDGAGKSTLADGVRKSFCRPVRTIYMGFGGQGTPPFLTRFRLPGIGAPGHLLVLLWQSAKAQYLRFQGYLVIFDRYSYDTLAAPPQQRQNWVSRVGSWVKVHTCPAPHLVVVLDAPGQLMYERKGELTVEILEAQRQRYLALRERFPQLRVVDATQSEDAVRIEVLTHLWASYRTHWR